MSENDRQYLENTAKLLVGCSMEAIRSSLEVAYKMGRFDATFEMANERIDENIKETNEAIARMREGVRS